MYVLTPEVPLVAVLHRSAWARRSSCKVSTQLLIKDTSILMNKKWEGIHTSVEDMHGLFTR